MAVVVVALAAVWSAAWFYAPPLIRQQLQSLVDDRTITADQADKVAKKLAETGDAGRGQLVPWLLPASGSEFR